MGYGLIRLKEVGVKRILAYEIFITLLVGMTLIFRFSTFRVFELINLLSALIIAVYSIFKTMKGVSSREEMQLFYLFIAMGMLFSLAYGMRAGFALDRALFLGLSLFVLTESILEKQ